MKGNAMEGPKSICACGHTGDGPNSQHITDGESLGSLPADDDPNQGHGACTGCDCQKFIWKGFINEP